MQHTDFTEADYFAVEFAVVDTKLIEEMNKKKKLKCDPRFSLATKDHTFLILQRVISNIVILHYRVWTNN